MRRRTFRITYTSMVCFLLIVFILCMFFQATMGTEEPEKQKELSAILYHTRNNGWESLQDGIKQAEDDFSVNINYVIMREGARGEEQLNTIKREIENGADGILLAVCDYEDMLLSFIEKRFGVPVVMIESGLNEDAFPLISADNYAMGQRLGEEILKDFEGQEQPTVAVSYDGPGRDSVQLRRQGLLDALEGKAKVISMSVAMGGEKADVAAAFHKDGLLGLVEREGTVLEEAKVYGIGNTADTVAALDQGKISKLIFQNEFNVGYLGVQSLLGKISGNEEIIPEIDYYCVSRQELYMAPYEQLLFPMIE